MILFDADKQTGIEWQNVNDTVMGGHSTSSHTIRTTGELLFEGHVSLKDGGGFASVKSNVFTPPEIEADQVKMIVKGDGHEYYLRLYPEGAEKGVAYVHHFKTKNNVWQSLRFNLKDFDPAYRGRSIDDFPPLKAQMIEQVGFMIKDGQEGDFKLLVKHIELR